MRLPFSLLRSDFLEKAFNHNCGNYPVIVDFLRVVGTGEGVMLRVIAPSVNIFQGHDDRLRIVFRHLTLTLQKIP